MPTNKRKSEILGMPYGTAGNRLRKMILFHLLQQYRDNICFKCGEAIEAIEDLSIEHKESWQMGGAHLFWDLDNIAFSHLKCNRQSINLPGSGASRRKIGPEGTAWCNRCKEFLPTGRFYKNRSNWNGYSHQCISCQRNSLRRV